MFPLTEPADQQLCMFCNCKFLHGLVTLWLIHLPSPQSWESLRPPGVSKGLLLELWVQEGNCSLWKCLTRKKEQVSETIDPGSNIVPNFFGRHRHPMPVMYRFEPQINLTALADCDCEVGSDAPLHHPGISKSIWRNCDCCLKIYPRAAMLNGGGRD